MDSLDLDRLEFRRVRGDLIQTYKILSKEPSMIFDPEGLVKMDVKTMFPVMGDSNIGGGEVTVQK